MHDQRHNISAKYEPAKTGSMKNLESRQVTEPAFIVRPHDTM